MTTYVVGQTLQFGLTIRDSAGALANLGGGNPTCTITRPDATTGTASVTNPSTGVYLATFASTLPGRYLASWTGSGTNSGDLPYPDLADVWPADPRFIISLADARAALNLAASATTNDDELRLYIAAATSVIEDICGPVLQNTVIERHSGATAQAVLLASVPASVTSVTEDGVTLTEGTDFCWDEAGILWRGSRPKSGLWAEGARNVVVTYVVGTTSVNPTIIKAGRDLVAWQYGQQQLRRPGPAYGVPAVNDQAALYLPRRSRDEIEADLRAVSVRLPGFA